MNLVNGIETTQIDIQDRGLLYGDGLFETIAIRDGRAEFLECHLNRLQRGCERLGIAMPADAVLTREIEAAMAGEHDAVLKIILTRGIGERGYRLPRKASTTRVISTTSLPQYPPDHYRKGVRVRMCQTPLGENRVLAGIKHLCRLEQVMARSEWDDPAIPEGLMCNHVGDVIEGTMSNLFLVHNSTLITPDLSLCGVEGIMRSVILERASQMNMATEVRSVSLQELLDADELFICNSLIRIWPVMQLDEQGYVTGPITEKIYNTLL
jgi:4-amino-4-deoxychorismate lyase